MTITFSPRLKADQLKQVARLCGLSRTGTKTAISDRIVENLKGFTPLAPGTRVLSIDLGIRNLAYSLLEVPGPGQQKPILHAWERLALIPKTSAASRPRKAKTASRTADDEAKEEKAGTAAAHEVEADSTPKKKKRGKKKTSNPTKTQEESDATLTAALAGGKDPTTTPVPIEDFSPAHLSQLAVDLLLTRLLPLRPDVVTLEQQRFRSMGGAGVFEWTLRVNSLEAMLYASLTTLRALGRWPDGRLEGIVARNVLEFMVAGAGGGAGGASAAGAGAEGRRRMVWEKKVKTDDNKRMKKDIIGRMLMNGDGVRIAEVGGGGGDVEAVRGEYLERWSPTDGRRTKGGADSLKKLDDLADSLLQGIAFIRWQENKRKLLEGGVEALESQTFNDD